MLYGTKLKKRYKRISRKGLRYFAPLRETINSIIAERKNFSPLLVQELLPVGNCRLVYHPVIYR